MRISVATALLATAACSSSPPAPEDPRREDVKPVVIQAESPEVEKLLREILAGRSPEEQRLISGSQRHYEVGLAYFNKGDFDRAKEEAQEAVRLWPENIPARRLLGEVGELLVGRSTRIPSIGEQVAREALVATEQAQIEIAMHIVHGRRFFDAKMYESALQEFETAELKIRLLPYHVKAMNDLLPEVRSLMTRAKNAKGE